MKNHLVLLFLIPERSLSLPLSLSQSYAECVWLVMVVLLYDIFFSFSLAFRTIIDCVRILIFVVFLRNIHARFFTFNPIDWANFHYDYFVKFTIHTRLRLFIRITYTSHCACVCCVFFFGGDIIQYSLTERKNFTMRQTDRRADTERETETENKKQLSHVNWQWQCVVLVFVLLIQCDRVLTRYEINPFVCTLHLQLNINAMVRCTRRIVMCAIGNSLCAKDDSF